MPEGIFLGSKASKLFFLIIKFFSLLNVVLLFASAYGNTASIADTLAKGIGSTGIQVKSLNCELY